jgi:hypothetical protein
VDGYSNFIGRTRMDDPGFRLRSDRWEFDSSLLPGRILVTLGRAPTDAREVQWVQSEGRRSIPGLFVSLSIPG